MVSDQQLKRSVTARRLALAFAAVLLLFGMALVVTLVMLRRIGDAEAEVARLDHAKHAGHMAAAQVREQYIHQAHTLIEFNTSHLDHYREAVEATQRSVEHVVAMAETDEERALAAEIGRLAAENDRDFIEQVVPAVVRGDRDAMVMLGERLEAVVDRVVEVNERLNAQLERRSDAARHRADAFRARALQATVACFALAILLATVVGVWLARSIMRPVAALRAGVRRVAAGELSARIPVTGEDEFAELATAFNRMAGNLVRHQEEIVRAHKLASIGQVAAGVAHEINNPLGVILGYAKLLRKQAEGGQADELRIIEDEATQCQRIVQGLLDLARPQQLEVGAVDLGELARDAVARLDETGKLDGRQVVVAPPDAGVTTVGDAGKLRQVVSNVLVNAAQATSEGGHIRVTARRDNDDAVLEVADDGPGMSPEVRAHIFDPFFTTKREGTGLGLVIAQAIIDAHGGHIEVESSPGHGTKVSLRLPDAKQGEERP